MSAFSYVVVSSVLHDRKAIDAIFSKYEPFFAGLNGQRAELEPALAEASADASAKASAASARLPFFFILTGGTEGIVLDYLSSMARPAGKPFPLVLIAHPHHNSLPAALEIAARAKQDGGSAILILLKAPSDAEAGKAIGDAVLLCSAIHSMRNSRIGAIGQPSDWLVASSQSSQSVASTWGTAMESIPLSALEQEIDKIRASEGMEATGNGSLSESAALFLKNAEYKREPTPADMYKSDTIYRALRSIVADRHLDCLTLRCFDLVNLDRSTGCFALSQLSDEGIDAGCEGDIPSALALRWMRLLSGKAAWMANPANISLDGAGGKGKLLLAHCTVPRTLLKGYGIRSHFESGLGVAVAGNFPPGPVTVVRLGGIALDQAWIAEGFIGDGPSDEGLCRTQAIITMDDADLRKLLENPLGNHLVVAFGHCKQLARRYCALEKIIEI